MYNYVGGQKHQYMDIRAKYGEKNTKQQWQNISFSMFPILKINLGVSREKMSIRRVYLAYASCTPSKYDSKHQTNAYMPMVYMRTTILRT